MSNPVPPGLSIAELTAEAAELLRSAALTTSRNSRPGLVHPSDAAETAAALAGLTARLPELLDVLAAFLSSEQAAGRIGPGPGEDPGAGSGYDALRAARDAREQLYEAGRTAALLAESLASAAVVLAPLGSAHPVGRPAEPHV
ncbi:hypothetical protein OG689_00445 [Kitasatospora sp. NBC_00240]|uniref:hypothetical protein n=1 Tax=Kitasatospora sp. NBC_00240 TaxID=2903567 RepID=UPI002254F4BD|nr:hypothetical protein [Kitasatospora sp. NBC_00240]MCX5207802.1 hypothetical protein [Kitasatospora sp. NBC_00240]